MTVLLPVLVPFVAALLCLLCTRHLAAQRVLGLLGAGGTFLAGIVLLMATAEGDILTVQLGNWPAPFGISFVADLLGALMVAVSGLIGLAAAVYSLGDIEKPLQRLFYFPLLLFLLMGVNGAFLTGDLFNLYVWFEVMLLSSFVLLVIGGGRDQLEGGLKYVVINLLSSALFLIGVGVLYGKVGTLNMADIALKLGASEDAFLINSTGILLLVSFGIKAALFPFFFWLPASYHTPPVAIAALFAGLLTKVGVYALIRAYTLFFRETFEAVQGILLFIAGATMLTGVLGAAAHFSIRRILSFHIVSQIGYMVMGLAVFTQAALAGAIFYLLHHILVKANLFLIGGLVERRTGSDNLARCGGLYKAAPFLALLFFIPAFSLGGIPPLSGFWAKFAVLEAGLDARHYLLVGVALLVGLFTLFSMTKIWAEAFWKKLPEGVTLPEPLPAGRRLALVAPCVVLAAMTAWLGLSPQGLFTLSQTAASQLTDPSAYIEAVLGPAASSTLAAHE